MATSRRDVQRKGIMRVHDYVNDEQQDHSAAVLKVQLELLESLWEKFYDSHLEINEDAVGEEALAVQHKYLLEVEEAYIQAKTKLTVKMNVKSGSAQAEIVCGAGATEHTSQLEKIKLGTFTGDYHNWYKFKDTFIALVHEAKMSDGLKMQYLMRAVQDEAATALSGFQVKDDFYEQVWETLVKRYDNERLIVKSLLALFFDLPVLVRESNTGLLKMVDTTNDVIRQLTMIGLDVSSWDAVLIFVLLRKLDSVTSRAWEMTQTTTNLPKLSELLNFLECRARSLDNILPTTSAPARGQAASKSTGGKVHTATVAVSRFKCQGDHQLSRCAEFLSLNLDQRFAFVRERKLCFNCLRTGHSPTQCRFSVCPRCTGNKLHHSVLCYKLQSAPRVTAAATSAATGAVSKNVNATVIQEPEAVLPEAVMPEAVISEIVGTETVQTETVGAETVMPVAVTPDTVLLATANVLIQAKDGTIATVRALCDGGAQTSLISDAVVQYLRLKRKPAKLSVCGIGNGAPISTHGIAVFEIGSLYDKNFKLTMQALILSEITSLMPKQPIHNNWPELSDLNLADPNYAVPGKIELLVGADVLGSILIDGIRPGNINCPSAQNTRLGWVLFGPVLNQPVSILNCSITLHSHLGLEQCLNKFWELEEVPVKVKYVTPDEKRCEEIFCKNVQKNADDHYEVVLPFNDKLSQLGTSRYSAVQQFLRLEKRHASKPEVWQQVVKFMTEYETLGHMKLYKAPERDLLENLHCYIPYMGVETSQKYRVVFNASSPTSSGLSLNDTLLVGEKLQDNLYEILLTFRMYRVALIADIVKMYRQVNVQEQHQKFQCIVWRKSDQEPLQTYKLTTVTYGTASAPHSAVRALIRCAEDGQFDFPGAAIAVKQNFYVDDFLCSVDTIDEALDMYADMQTLLSTGGFELAKWASNQWAVMERMNPSVDELSRFHRIGEGNPDEVRVLGLRWLPGTDSFYFRLAASKQTGIVTKRFVVSEIAKLYDPDGFLSPVIIVGKLLIQELWIVNLKWDDPLPEELLNKWNNFIEPLKAVERIRIPRWIGMAKNKQLQLHGFADASSRAYAAVIYARTSRGSLENSTQVVFVTSKTKVAPVKTVCVPRLELCAAQLVVKLMVAVLQALNYPDCEQFFWTDSSVVLQWIQKLPCTLKPFVANRVTNIQEHSTPQMWHHVTTADNPADCASRGLAAPELQEHPLWWTGPSWLSDNSENWPKTSVEVTNSQHQQMLAEIKSPVVAVAQVNISWLTVTKHKTSYDFLETYSSFNTTGRVLAYVLRFIFNARAKKTERERKNGQLTADEMENAYAVWLKHEQKLAFSSEFRSIETSQKVSKSSRLCSLVPLIDNDRLLRVGGRLDLSDLPWEQKHPLIVPQHSRFAHLLIEHAHTETLHGGVQLVLQFIRQKYWIICARRKIRLQIHRCVTCFRLKPVVAEQLMGQLPDIRTTPARAFLHSSVDYCGPITVKAVKGRCRTMLKGYIVVFVCLVTRAVHLEMVTDLTAESFVAAFRRFIGRRGKCVLMLSDNGTTFVRAAKTITEIHQIWQSDEVLNYLSKIGVTWKFIPPAAPHQGGLWEAAVKSTKFHLHRVTKGHVFALEELQTLLIQIEAVLNSRPISKLFDDAADIQALTPGHFLIGEPLVTLPDAVSTVGPINNNNRWEHVKRSLQSFWVRWKTEYISQLQAYPKWREQQKNIKVGDVVIVKHDNLPPGQWLLGVIEQVHKGSDGLVRVVTLRYKNGTMQRPIQRICVLPIDDGQPLQPSTVEKEDHLQDGRVQLLCVMSDEERRELKPVELVN